MSVECRVWADLELEEVGPVDHEELCLPEDPLVLVSDLEVSNHLTRVVVLGDLAVGVAVFH